MSFPATLETMIQGKGHDQAGGELVGGRVLILCPLPSHELKIQNLNGISGLTNDKLAK